MSASTVAARDGSIQVASSPGRVVIDVQAVHDLLPRTHADLALDVARARDLRAKLSRHIRLAERESVRLAAAAARRP